MQKVSLVKEGDSTGLTVKQGELAGMEKAELVGIFFEEAEEQVNDLDRLLLSLDRSNPDEQLTTIFCTAHSLKEASAAFSFNTMADITHALESVIDRMRHCMLPLSRVTLDLALEAVAVLRLYLVAHRLGQGPDEERGRLLQNRLQDLMGPAPLAEDPRPAFELFGSLSGWPDPPPTPFPAPPRAPDPFPLRTPAGFGIAPGGRRQD